MSRKSKKKKTVRRTPKKVVVPPPVQAVKKIRINPEILGRSKIKKKRSINPFLPAQHPPSVTPEHSVTMAQDTTLNTSLSWAAQSLYMGAWQEGLTFLGYAYLAELAQRPEYRRIVEVIATEMTRKWIKLQSTGDDENDKSDKIKILEKALKKFKVRDLFRQMSEGDGLFGRMHLFVDIGDYTDREELITPIADNMGNLIEAKIGRNSLKRLVSVEPVWCYPSNYNASDPLHVDWYNPSRWIVQGKEMHRSRLITFVGREVPDLLKPAYSFGGLSLTQMAKPYVDNWLQTRQSVSDLVSAFSVMILQTDLQMLLAPSDGSSSLFDRADLFNNMRDNHGLMMVNKDSEDVKNVTTPLGSLDVLQAQSQEHMSSVSGIPLVKLLGIQPAGLNASSDGEIRTFYDWIEAFQEKLFSEKLKYVMDIIQLSEFGEIDEEITFKFEPLWSLDEKAMAEVRKTEAETDDILINGCGSLSPEESRKRIANDPDTPYSSLDVDDMPEPPEEDTNINLRGTMPLEDVNQMQDGEKESGPQVKQPPIKKQATEKENA